MAIFSVNSEGKITLLKVEVLSQEWTIGDDKLYKGTTGISSGGEYSFWSGNATASSAKFSVKHDGTLKGRKKELLVVGILMIKIFILVA